jgi:hypothetical protein
MRHVVAAPARPPDNEVAWADTRRQDAGQVVVMRALLRTVRSLVPLIAILVAMLASGGGLPGLVHALSGGPTHVCTCVSGGSHASCPVCNPAAHEGRHSRRPEADGAPCGGDGVAAIAANEPSALPVPFGGLVVAALRRRIVVPERRDIEDRSIEPETPPPRCSRA